MSVKHKFSSIIPDGLDPALVKPSNWNDDHIADFNGIAKSVSGSLTQAIADTDYLTPTGSGALLTGITAAKVGLGNVTNESKTTMFTSPAFTGVPTGPTAAANTNTTQLSTCEFVLGQASNTSPASPLDSAVVGTSTMFARGDHSHPANFTTNATDIQMNGTQALGSSTKYARADHVHPSDTSRAPLASPTFTGTVTAPSFTSTAATGTAPFTVASNTMVSNLNAEMISGNRISSLYTQDQAALNPYKLHATVKATLDPIHSSSHVTFGMIIDNAPNIVDGISLTVGNLVLIDQGADNPFNGLWWVLTVGTGSNGIWYRYGYTNAWNVLVQAVCFVKNGNYAGKTYRCNIPATGTINTTGITWQEHVVDLATDQTIAGNKTFTNSIATAGNLNFTGTGNRITGDFSNTTLANRVMFQSSVTNGGTSMYSLPNGTATAATYQVLNSSDPNNTSKSLLGIDATISYVASQTNGTGTLLPLSLRMSSTNHLLLSTNGNIVVKTAAAQADDDSSAKLQVSGGILERGAGLIGYGTGSGGTVTQATSKATAVTLNKPSGQITMHNAALASGVEIGFNLNNSSIGAADCIIVNTYVYGSYYTVRAVNGGAGLAYIYIKNNTAGSLSEAVTLNFSIIKGAIS